MGDKLNKAMNRALEAAKGLSIPELARQAGVHPVTMRRWKIGERGVDPKAALKVARALKQQSAQLAEVAQQLEDIANATKGGSDG